MFLLIALACSGSEPVIEAPPEAPPAADAPPAPPVADATLAGTMNLDPGTSTIGFHGKKITGSHDGKFNGFSGTATIDAGALVGLATEVDVASVQTDKTKLDDHLRGEDFFDVANHAKASFKSTEIAVGEDGTTVTGDLTIRGVTESVTFPAKVSVSDKSVELDAELTIDRQKFGVAYPGKPDDLISDEVALTLDLTFTGG
ncbi:MAG: YceI family protein [Proteobacteria bacterium]|nr:YceI family protein [Pseudomonadota bacterium]MCP4921435.1 YceI family protein [Pseudomonadota bacterium]